MGNLKELSIQKQMAGMELLSKRVTDVDFDLVIDALSEVLNTKNRIILSGVGKNASLAAKASETFASLGIPSMYLNICHYTHGDAGFILDGDILVHISKSGKTEEMVNAAKHLRDNRPHIKQILLSCDKHEANIFDIVFNIGDIEEADVNGLAPTTSSTVLLVLLDTIGVILSSKINFSNDDFYKFHPGGSLGKKLSDSNLTKEVL